MTTKPKPAPETPVQPEAVENGTTITTNDICIVDNTEAVEAVEPEPEASEQDLGNGIVLVSYL